MNDIRRTSNYNQIIYGEGVLNGSKQIPLIGNLPQKYKMQKFPLVEEHFVEVLRNINNI